MTRIALLLALALGACGTPQPQSLRGSLTRAEIAQGQGPLLYAEVEGLGSASTLEPAGRNGTVVTWTAADTVGVSLDRGLLVATRGLGHDLMSADVAGTRAALSGGPRADYPRHHAYLDGEAQTTFRAFRCVMDDGTADTIESFGLRHATTRYTETCYSTDAPVRNTYWIGGDGTFWRTRQWVGPETGHLLTETLRR